jgi:hypothetical protein
VAFDSDETCGIKFASLRFDPPYDSPIEEILAWGLSKHLVEGATLDKQVEVGSRFARFRIDLVASTPAGDRVGFECDGKDFHTDRLRDECRDALILGTQSVSAIYRFRGQDLVYHENDCLYFIANKDPRLFSARALRNLELLASDEARQSCGGTLEEWKYYEAAGKVCGYEVGDCHWFFYNLPGGPIGFVERRSLAHPRGGRMHRFLAFARQHTQATFDELVARFRSDVLRPQSVVG